MRGFARFAPAPISEQEKSPTNGDEQERTQLPLIFQNTSAGFGTLLDRPQHCGAFIGLPRFHRAGPSTSLDKSVAIQL